MSQHRPLRILHVLPRLETGGIETSTVALVCGLLQRGHQVFVVSEGGALVPSVEAQGGVHIPYPAGRKTPWHWFLCARFLKQHIDLRRIDVIHPHSRAPGWATSITARWTRKPWVATFHGVHGHSTALKKKYNEVLTWGNRVIAPTHYVAQHVHDIYDVGSERLRVVHEGIDPDAFQPIHAPDVIQRWRRAHGIPLKSRCVLLPGRLTALKGHHVALEALAQLQDVPNIILCLMGEPDPQHRYHRELLQKIQDLNLQHHVVWISPHTPIQQAYAISNLVIVPSQVPEAFGRVVAEAQAMEKMVIVTHPGGASELIKKDQTGWLIPRNHPEALAHCIRLFFAYKPTDRRLREECARRWVTQHFHIERMVDQTLDVYREIVS